MEKCYICGLPVSHQWTQRIGEQPPPEAFYSMNVAPNATGNLGPPVMVPVHFRCAPSSSGGIGQ